MADSADKIASLTGMTRADLLARWEAVKENSRQLEACGSHNFALQGLTGLNSKYLCTRCAGTIDGVAYSWYMRGRLHGAADA